MIVAGSHSGEVCSMTAVIAKPSRPSPVDTPYSTHWSRLCQHDLVVRLRGSKSGVNARAQCRKCGKGVGKLVKSAGVFEQWDYDLEKRVEDEFKAAVEKWQSSITFDDHARPGFWESYNTYLQSDVWRVKRGLVMQRANGVCECCGQHRAKQVHHLEYPQIFGHEPLWTLRAVCLACHEIIHPHMRQR